MQAAPVRLGLGLGLGLGWASATDLRGRPVLARPDALGGSRMAAGLGEGGSEGGGEGGGGVGLGRRRMSAGASHEWRKLVASWGDADLGLVEWRSASSLPLRRRMR